MYKIHKVFKGANMGAFDFLTLGFFIIIIVMAVTFLVKSIRSTEDPVKQRYYRKTYTPIIVVSVIFITIYIFAFQIGSIAFNL